MIYTPREYQKEIISAMCLNDRFNIWADMGLGKTSSTLFALDLLTLFSPINKTLVLGPKRVISSVWEQEAKKWDNLKHLRVSIITGTPKQRTEAAYKEAEIYTTNYENLPWLVDLWGNNWPYARVVADESTRLKSLRLRGGGKRVAAIRKMAHSKIKEWYNLTGTPSPNGLTDLWGQQWFIDKGEALGRTYSGFTTRWFRPVNMFGNTPGRLIPLPYAFDDIQSKLKQSTICLRAEECFPELEAPLENIIKIRLPKKADGLYKDIQKEAFAEIKGIEVNAVNAAAKTTKCLQIASGVLYHDSGWEHIHDEKIDALKSIEEENAGKPLLVAYHWKSDLVRLKKAFPHGRELGNSGRVIEQWNEGQVPMLFVHPASAGHGLNLQHGGRIIVFFSLWWNLEYVQQVLERIGPVRQLQSGYKRKVLIYYILAEKTFDTVVYDRHKSKREIQDLLKEYMRAA